VFVLAEKNLLQHMDDSTDDQLVTLVKAGNSDAFVELTARYMSLIRAKAAPFHSSMLDVDDLCQEGLMGLLNATRTYQADRKAAFKTYAGVCISNCIIMAYRWATGQKNLPLNNFVPLCDTGSCGVPAQEEANPESMLVNREEIDLLKQHIKRNLSKMEHQVLLLYLGGCSYKEIAVSLKITSKAADNALQRVRRKLKEPF
jgi:RNA polymerase sporulation-specific sigma factor